MSRTRGRCGAALPEAPIAVVSGTVDTALTAAVRHHQAGRLSDAESLYQQVLARHPDNADVLHLLGVVASQTGDSAVALDYLRRSVASNPDSPVFHNTLGRALQDCGRMAEAIAAYRAAVELGPHLVGAWANLGAVLLATGDPAQAAVAYQRTIALRPDIAEAHVGHGTALMALARFDAASEAFRRAVDLRPDYAFAHGGLGAALSKRGRTGEALPALRRAIALKPDFGEAHANLGDTLRRLGQPDAAEAALRRAIELAPGAAVAYANLGNLFLDQEKYVEAIDAFSVTIGLDASSADVHNNLGNALKAVDRLDGAIDAYRAAVSIRPDYAEAHSNIGAALYQQGKYTESAASYRTAIDLRPDLAEAHTNLGNTLFEQGRFDESITCHDTSLVLQPGYATAHFNGSIPLLAQGRLGEGWRAYEHRLRRSEARTVFVPAPPWDGGPLDGKTIMVHAEQGIGDEILFASCLPDLIARAGHCLIECEPRVGALFKRSFPTATVGGRPRDDLEWIAQAPPVDAYVMLASLMRHFRPDLASFPDHRGYLVADDARREDFADRLSVPGRDLKIGISWRSMQGSHWHQTYSALADWHDILALPGAQFVNLQYDDSAAELADIGARFGIHVHDFADLDRTNDLDSVAALISALDLVIAPSNTVAALAGALGIPVLILVRAPNWCQFGTDRYPWFPSATAVVREIGAAGWGPALDDVARHIRRLLTLRGKQGS